MNKLRTMTFAVLILSVCGATAGAQHSSAGPAPDNSQPKTTEQQFKNIQVLKGLPADQLMPAMQFISASLGVECQFCHVQDAFEKDDKKPKQTARKMMEMMITINQENFEGHRAVTCNSCHRGNIHPEAIPAVMGDEAPKLDLMAKSEPRGASEDKTGNKNADAGHSAADLIDNYIKAAGGAAAIDKINSRTMKGTITFGDRKIPIDIYSKDPGKRISFTHTPDGDSVTAFDGNQGWLGFPGRPAREMHGAEIEAAAMDADLHFASHLKDMFGNADVHGTEQVDSHEAYLVVGERPGKTPLHLYFDKQSGLLVRMVRYADTPLGDLPTQIDYADYREAGGVKIPYRWTLARPSGRFTIQISEVKENVPVDDAKFVKPPAPEEKPPAK